MEQHRVESSDERRNIEQQSTSRAHERKFETLERLRKSHARFGRSLPRTTSDSSLNFSHPHASEIASLRNMVDSLTITSIGRETGDDFILTENQELRTRWETAFRQWSKPLRGEAQKLCGRAERAIRQALYKDRVLRNILETLQGNGQREIKDLLKISPQGSYRSGTRTEKSDFDLSVYYNWDSPANDSSGFVGFQKFKGLIGEALARSFNGENIQRGNKVFKIKKSVFNIEVDVLAAFVYKRDIEQRKRGIAKTRQITELEFYRDDGIHTVNRIDEAHRNKTIKHQQTGRRFKKAVRILKRLREEMRESNIKSSENALGSLIESVLYIVTNSSFGHKYITNDIKHILNYCIQNTSGDEKCQGWMYADKFTHIFDKKPSNWSREQVYHFVVAAQEYMRSQSVVDHPRRMALSKL